MSFGSWQTSVDYTGSLLAHQSCWPLPRVRAVCPSVLAWSVCSPDARYGCWSPWAGAAGEPGEGSAMHKRLQGAWFCYFPKSSHWINTGLSERRGYISTLIRAREELLSVRKYCEAIRPAIILGGELFAVVVWKGISNQVTDLLESW